uniref:RNase H type-1 domain-containing protein n=1 Tax=Quercus lobata TaxID=97700 RepID=A0A7N2QZ17_QUELO
MHFDADENWIDNPNGDQVDMVSVAIRNWTHSWTSTWQKCRCYYVPYDKVWNDREMSDDDIDGIKHPSRQPVPREVVKWSPLAESVYKVNFDRAGFEDQACARLGVVVKDLAGLIIGALSQKIRFPGSMVMVEALAACRAVLFAKEISVFRVVVEGGFSASNQGCQFRKAVQDSIWAYY